MAFAGGAPAVVNAVLSYISTTAESRNAALRSEIAVAIAAATQRRTTAPLDRIELGSVTYADGTDPFEGKARHLGSYVRSDSTVYKPPRLELDFLDATNAAEVAKVAERLATSYDVFLAENFPGLDTYIASAETWLTDALAGSTGINTGVEDQIWVRDRTRVLRESSRASDEAMTAWAGRGFAMPPGALVNQLATIERDAQEKIGESSRERAIKTWDTELENVRLAVNKSLDLRGVAVSAATEYMKAVALAPQLGLEVTKNVQAAHQRLNDSLMEFFKEDKAVREYNLAVTRDEDARVRKKVEVDFAANNAAFAQRVSATIAGAQAQGQQAASALNGMNAQGSVSGSDQTITNI